MSIQSERLAVIQRVHAEWTRGQRTAPDPRYSRDSPSQYTESIDDVSCSTEANDDLQRRTDEALAAAGLPVVW